MLKRTGVFTRKYTRNIKEKYSKKNNKKTHDRIHTITFSYNIQILISHI